MQEKKISKRSQIVEQLRREISEGVYEEDRPLPGEMALSKRFNVCYATMRQAIGELEVEGLLQRRNGVGTYLNPTRSIISKSLGMLLLVSQRASTVGIMALIRGASDYLDSIGSQLIVINRPPETWNTTLVRSLFGVMIVPICVTNEHIDYLDRLGLEHITATNNDLNGKSIYFNLKPVVERMVKSLLDLGHRRFALISGHDVHSDRFRKEVIRDTLAEAGIDFSTIPDFRTNYEIESAWDASRQILKLNPRPTAVIAFDDTLALQIIREAQKAGLRVPEDISVVGFNDAPHSSLTVPSISTVRVPFAEAGRESAEALCLHHMRKKRFENISLDCYWVPRESTGPAGS